MTPRKLFCLIVLLISSSVFCACALQGTPRHSLDALRSALLNHDADEALKYVDVDSIVDHLVEDTLQAKEWGGGTDLNSMGPALGRFVASAMMPQTKALLRKGLTAAIESDDQLGYFSSIKKSSVWYLSIEENGDTAVVTPRGDDKVRFKMRRADRGYWKITELILKNGP